MGSKSVPLYGFPCAPVFIYMITIHHKIFKWLTLDMIIFIVANTFLIARFNDRFWVLGDMSYFTLLVLGLAAYRTANILSNEAVTKPLRAPFVDEMQKDGKTIEEPKQTGFLGAVGLLIYCPSCTGVWLSATLVYFYIFFPEPTFVVALFLALSAMERIIAALVGRLKTVPPLP
jgi:Protein of unknown function (DUF1360)